MSHFERWKETHQPFELRYHQHQNFRWRDDLWNEQWDNVLGKFGSLKPDSFLDGQNILDVGCGSRPALDWFLRGNKFFIDPLLEEYEKITKMMPFWKQHPSTHLFSKPAEECIEELVGKMDFVLCWNVLDHSFDPFKIVQNIYKYVKPTASVLLGTDLHEKEHLGHPGVRSKREFKELVQSLFFVKKEAKRGDFKNCREISWMLTPIK